MTIEEYDSLKVGDQVMWRDYPCDVSLIGNGFASLHESEHYMFITPLDQTFYLEHNTSPNRSELNSTTINQFKYVKYSEFAKQICFTESDKVHGLWLHRGHPNHVIPEVSLLSGFQYTIDQLKQEIYDNR